MPAKSKDPGQRRPIPKAAPTPPPDPAATLLTPEAAAARLGIKGEEPARTVLRLARRGIFQRVKVLRWVLINSASVDAWLPWEQAAQRLGLDKVTDRPRFALRVMVRRGELRGLGAGGQLLLWADDVAALIAGRR